MIDFTVAIPTYNGEKRLPLVLDKLRSQTGTDSISWEVIVVDNNSTDNTAQVIQAYQQDWPANYPLKYYLETQQGAAFARQRAIEVATGELVGFMDDDNVPALDWVIEAYQFGQNYPQAGAYGGQIHGDFEVSPPENFEKIEGFLAIRERGNSPNRYQPEVLSLPPGAAMVVRRSAWCKEVSATTLSGKVGNSMVQGDDWEPLMYLHKAGWEIWYNPAMHTYHQIPHWRLEKDYLLSLIHGSCLSFCPLKMMTAKPWQKPVIIGRTVVGNLYKALRHRVKYYGKLDADLVATCELQIYLSRVASVFYFFNRGLKNRNIFPSPNPTSKVQEAKIK